MNAGGEEAVHRLRALDLVHGGVVRRAWPVHTQARFPARDVDRRLKIRDEHRERSSPPSAPPWALREEPSPDWSIEALDRVAQHHAWHLRRVRPEKRDQPTLVALA